MWELETARMSVFADANALAQLSDFPTVTGSQPVQSGSRPAEKITQNVGLHAGRAVIINVAPSRADLVLTPGAMLGTPTPSNSMPTIGKFGDVVGELLALGGQWLRAKPAVQRLAFGAVLSELAPDGHAALALLLKYVPVAKDIGASHSDFLLQWNRPTTSKIVAGVTINRLTKWSIQHVQTVQIGSSVGVAHGPTEFRAQLELDLSNQPGSTIAGASTLPFLRELTDLGADIAEHGDIP